MSSQNSGQLADLVRQLIEGARAAEATELDLNGCQLSELPESITQLSNLTSLNLGRNQLTELPELISQLSNLTSLVLWGNWLTELPESIAKLSNLTLLDLGNNRLTELPESITQLSNLTLLGLLGNQLTQLPESITQLSNLTSLDLGGNEFTELAESVTQLRNLTSLGLSSNKLIELPESIYQLGSLTSLDLRSNQLTGLPESITQLSNLTSLGLENNYLTQLPDSITQLTNLASLDLGGNLLTDISESITQLTDLTSLGLENNYLTQLPDSITQLPNLTSLDLGRNLLTDIPESITRLRDLTSLDLMYNHFTDIPESITQLSNLTWLRLWGNDLTEMPESITRLSKLVSLDCGYNELTAIPESITQLSKLVRLELAGNPIKSPPQEIVDAGLESIRNYFSQIKVQSVEQMYEAKLLIVGEPGAGKTSLMGKLLDPDYEIPQELDSSTVGVEVKTWIFPREGTTLEFVAHLWDFGGQKRQYMTHQFFLTPQSLYVIVTDGRRQDTEFNYWFKIIKLLGGESPVVVVLNRREDYSSVSEFDQSKYQRLYPELTISKYELNLARDPAGFAALQEQLQRQLVTLKHVGDPLPASWIPIRKALEARKAEKHISSAEYFAVCRGHGLVREADGLNLSRYLHNIGIIVHYQDDATLADLVILDPNWAVGAVYALLADQTVENQGGWFQKSWLFTLWEQQGYDFAERQQLLNLVRKDHFELCYELPGSDGEEFIAPQLLPTQRPEFEFDTSGALHFHYRYPFMPDGILERLIVRLHSIIAVPLDGGIVWQHGVLLSEGGATALVVREELIEKGQQAIQIAVVGLPTQARELLLRIRLEIESIHGTFFKAMAVDRLLPCCGPVCSNDTPRMFEFRELERLVDQRRPTTYCSNCEMDIGVKRLLEGVATADGRKQGVMDGEGVMQSLSQQAGRDEIADLVSLAGGLTINIDNSSVQQTSLQVTVEQKVELARDLRGALGMLEDDLLETLPPGSGDEQELVEVFDAAKKAARAVERNSDPGAVKSGEEVSRLMGVIKRLADGGDKLGGLVKNVENGVGQAQKLAKTYNQIADWCGMPHIPGALL